jgi:hypothetical protein
VPERQAWMITDVRITTAVVSLFLNPLKHILFTAYSSAETREYWRITSVDLSVALVDVGAY